MTTTMPPLRGAPPHTRSRPADAARTGEAEGQRDDPFLATLRSALGTRDRHDTRSAAEDDRVDGNADGDDRPERDDRAPESQPAPHALEPPVTNGLAEEIAEATTGDPSAAAAEDTPLPAVDPRPLGTPEWAEGRSGPSGLDPLHTHHPDPPAATVPPGLDPLHTPHPDTPDGSAATPDVEPAEAGVRANEGSPADPPRDPSRVESAVDAAATSQGDSATPDTDTRPAPGQGAARASDPAAGAVPGGDAPSAADAPSGTGPSGTGHSGAGPLGSDGTAAPAGPGRPPESSAAPSPSPPPSGTPDADHLVRLSELVDAARATVRRSGPSSIRVQLHPAELGTVEVEVRLDDDGLQMVLRAERHHGAERLASNLDQLRRGLEREGLQLSDIEVSVGTSDPGTDLRGDTSPRDADDDPAWNDEETVDRPSPSTSALRRASVTHRSEHRLTIEL